MNAAAINPLLLRLSVLLDLQRRVAKATPAERGYLIVNDTLAVVPYQQAALWRSGRLAALSGVAQPERDGPYARFLAGLLGRLARQPDAAPSTLDALRGGAGWAEFLPPEAACVPLPDPRGGLAGLLLLARQDAFTPAELQLLEPLAASYGLALAAGELPGRRRLRHWRRHAALAVVALLIGAALLAPVRSSVLAPGEAVAAHPALIRAPFDGVVEGILVAANAPVRKGDVLLRLATTERRARMDVAAKALELAQAEFAETAQQALADPRAKARLSLVQARLEQARLELDYDRDMLARAEITAPADGIAVFDAPAQWEGRPVALGERIMLIAPPESDELDIAVPIGQVQGFAPGAEVAFFANTDPDHPRRGRVTAAAYAATAGADGVLAYGFRARLDAGALRLGLRGTAKIYGARRPLILWLLRRPIAVAREWLTL